GPCYGSDSRNSAGRRLRQSASPCTVHRELLQNASERSSRETEGMKGHAGGGEDPGLPERQPGASLGRLAELIARTNWAGRELGVASRPGRSLLVAQCRSGRYLRQGEVPPPVSRP